MAGTRLAAPLMPNYKGVASENFQQPWAKHELSTTLFSS